MEEAAVWVQNRVRKAAYLLCLFVSVCMLLAMVWERMEEPSKDQFSSKHPASTLPPLWGFADSSFVNTADAKTLDTLPGVGEVIAQRIIEMRESLDGFRLPEDLMLVKGIGEKTYQKIMDALQEPLIQLE